jgi:hypothetical protein
MKIETGMFISISDYFCPLFSVTLCLRGRISFFHQPASSGDSQHIVFEGLTAGTNYTIEVRALGGLTGQSDWSDPSTHMSL